jgi:2-oxoglutarate ferredoxin oxidoreductase subunit gamma
VIISDGDIDYPKATNIDLLLAMTQEAVDKYAAEVKDGGIIITDSGYVREVPKGKYKEYSFPITQIAEDKVGKKIVANIIALGAIERLSKIVSPEAIINAIRARVPKGTEETNISAFKYGQDLVKDEETVSP